MTTNNYIRVKGRTVCEVRCFDDRNPITRDHVRRWATELQHDHIVPETLTSSRHVPKIIAYRPVPFCTHLVGQVERCHHPRHPITTATIRRARRRSRRRA